MQVDDLPAAWELKQLGDVCAINPSKAEVRGYPDDLDVTFVPMAAVSEAGGAIDSPDIRKLGEVKKGYTYFREGDVLFAKITPCMENGKAAVARGLANGLGFGSTEFHVLRPQEAVLPEWVFYWIRRPSFRERAAASFTGSVGQQRVPDWFLSEHQIPLPPLDEQRRIVERIEELARRIEEAKGLRHAARQEAEAVLPAALDENLGSAAIQDWSSTKLTNLVKVRTGQVDPTLPQYRDLPHVNGQRMESGTCTLLPFRTAAEDGMKSGKYLFEPGDILYSKIRPYLRKAAQVDFAGLCSADVYPLSIVSEQINARFLMWSLVAQPFSEYANALSLRARMPKLNRQQLLSYQLGLPPLDEQRRIVAYLDAVRAKAQALLRLQEETQRELEALMPSVLDRAFRGEL